MNINTVISSYFMLMAAERAHLDTARSRSADFQSAVLQVCDLKGLEVLRRAEFRSYLSQGTPPAGMPAIQQAGKPALLLGTVSRCPPAKLELGGGARLSWPLTLGKLENAATRRNRRRRMGRMVSHDSAAAMACQRRSLGTLSSDWRLS